MKISEMVIAGLAALVVTASPAFAGSTTATLSITVKPPLAIVFSPSSPTEPCGAAPGTVVSALSVTGGDGNPVTWSVSGGTDFAVSGSNVVVSPSGIAQADCGKVNTVGVTAAQQ